MAEPLSRTEEVYIPKEGMKSLTGPSQSPVFARSVRLLTLAGMWNPPDSASDLRRRLYSWFSFALWAFTMVNALGEIGGLVVVPDQPLESRCQNVCSSLFRLMALAMITTVRRHVRDIQAVVVQAERLACVDHAVRGETQLRVAALQQEARRITNRLIIGYACWFVYSSTGVVSQPAVDWWLSGHRPKPFLVSQFWLIVGADTPAREAVMLFSQILSQYTSTLIVVSFITFFTGLIIFLSLQAKIAGLLFEGVPYLASRGNPTKEREARKRLIHCITFHQDILNVVRAINLVLRLMVMALFFMCLGFLATMIYQMAAVAPTNTLFVATLSIFICSNIVIGIVCYSSDRLREATEEVVHRVMASDWTDAPESIQRLQCFILARASQPTGLWCWKVFIVSLPAWLQVLNKSYSVFAVMRSSDK